MPNQPKITVYDRSAAILENCRSMMKAWKILAYDASVAIWQQSTIRVRPNIQNPFDASSVLSMTRKKCVTDLLEEALKMARGKAAESRQVGNVVSGEFGASKQVVNSLQSAGPAL